MPYKNYEDRKAFFRRWWAKHKKRMNAKRDQWKKNHPENVRSWGKRYRAKKKENRQSANDVRVT